MDVGFRISDFAFWIAFVSQRAAPYTLVWISDF